MRNAEAEIGYYADDNEATTLLEEINRLYRTLSPENYFQAVEEIIDQARESLTAIPDPVERQRARRRYREVVEFAVDLVYGPHP